MQIGRVWLSGRQWNRVKRDWDGPPTRWSNSLFPSRPVDLETKDIPAFGRSVRGHQYTAYLEMLENPDDASQPESMKTACELFDLARNFDGDPTTLTAHGVKALLDLFDAGPVQRYNCFDSQESADAYVYHGTQFAGRAYPQYEVGVNPEEAPIFSVPRDTNHHITLESPQEGLPDITCIRVSAQHGINGGANWMSEYADEGFVDRDLDDAEPITFPRLGIQEQGFGLQSENPFAYSSPSISSSDEELEDQHELSRFLGPAASWSDFPASLSGPQPNVPKEADFGLQHIRSQAIGAPESEDDNDFRLSADRVLPPDFDDSEHCTIVLFHFDGSRNGPWLHELELLVKGTGVLIVTREWTIPHVFDVVNSPKDRRRLIKVLTDKRAFPSNERWNVRDALADAMERAETAKVAAEVAAATRERAVELAAVMRQRIAQRKADAGVDLPIREKTP